MENGHVADRAAENGQEHIALDPVDDDRGEDAEASGNAVAALEEGDVFKAVHDEHAKNGAGQRLPEILYKFRDGPAGWKDREREKAGEHRGGDHRVDKGKPRRVHVNPVGQAESEEAGHNGKGIGKSGFKSFCFHLDLQNKTHPII